MFALTLDGEGSLYRQVYRSLREAILGGRIPPGARLPSSRFLAAQARLSRNTVVQAYEQLVAEGYAVTRHGAGTYVAPEIPEILTTVEAGRSRNLSRGWKPVLSSYAERALRAGARHGFSWDLPRTVGGHDFRYGESSYLDFPHDTWARLSSRRLRRLSVRRLAYGPPEGASELREALAGHLGRTRGVVCTPEQINIVRGSQQAIDLTIRVLVDPGEPVALEEPHYSGFRMALEAAGAVVHSVPVDGEGMCVSDLADARLAVVTPSHQFPTGVIMSLTRRGQLLAWAQRTGAMILEDDYDSEFRYDGAPIESLQGLDEGVHVIHAGTMSKVLFPSLRIGYVVVPQPLCRVFAVSRALQDTGTPGIEQLVLADFIREGHFERHLRRTRVRHAARRDALLDAIHEYLGDRVIVSGQNAGLHVLLWLNDRSAREAQGIRREAGRRGVGVYPIEPCFRQPPRRGGLLLGYASLEEAAIREGIRILAKVVLEH